MKLQKNFWQSANFWFGLIGVVAAAFGALAFPEDAAKTAVSAIIALFGAGNILYHYFRSIDGKVLIDQLKASIKSYAFWASIITFLAGVLPVLPVAELQNLVKAILSGDTSLMIQAGFALLLVVIKLIKPSGLKV